MAKASSSSVHQAFSDTDTAPIDKMAAKEMIHSGKLRIAIPTRSPFLIPKVCTSA